MHHHHKNKLRVVLDVSIRFGGASLNNQLLPGPGCSSTLSGILVRPLSAGTWCLLDKLAVHVLSGQGSVTQWDLPCGGLVVLLSRALLSAEFMLTIFVQPTLPVLGSRNYPSLILCGWFLSTVSSVEMALIFLLNCKLWHRKMGSNWLSGWALVGSGWILFQSLRGRRTSQKLILITRSFLQRRSWVCCGVWRPKHIRITCLKKAISRQSFLTVVSSL